jgi:hypothetical protein
MLLLLILIAAGITIGVSLHMVNTAMAAMEMNGGMTRSGPVVQGTCRICGFLYCNGRENGQSKGNPFSPNFGVVLFHFFNLTPATGHGLLVWIVFKLRRYWDWVKYFIN